MIFSDGVDVEDNQRSLVKQIVDWIDGYCCIDCIIYEFEDYDLVFCYYECDGWIGIKKVMVGEDF